MSHPTILDIARAAGVSRTTASAALSGGGRISEATRDHVQAIASELGYVPNPAARHLRAGRKGAIGVYLPQVLAARPFYMAYTFGAANAARHGAFAVTLIVGSPDTVLPSALSNVDGVIVPDPFPGDPIIESLLASDLPVVTTERYLGEGPQPRVTVWTDYDVAERQLLDHMSEQGARHPVLITVETDLPVIRAMEDSYRAWCGQRGVPPRVRSLPLGFEPQMARDFALALLEGPEPPDAILAGSDGVALPVLDIAQRLGREVGTDLLLATCVDNPHLRAVLPAITAIEASPSHIGHDSARVLLDVLRGDDVPLRVRRQEPTIALRESTVRQVA